MLRAIPLMPVVVWMAVLSGAGCGHNDDAGLNTFTPVEESAREISEEDFARIALMQDQLPSEYTGFTANPDNGLVTPANSAASFGVHYWGLVSGGLEQFGWESGYGLAYNDFARTVPGVRSISNEIRLFNTADGASADFRAGEDQFLNGANNPGSSPKADNVQMFGVEIADQAGGVSFEGTIDLVDGWRSWTAIVAFRRGRIIGNVAIEGIGLTEDEQDRLKEQLKGLAVKLDNRITAVLGSPANPSVH